MPDNDDTTATPAPEPTLAEREASLRGKLEAIYEKLCKRDGVIGKHTREIDRLNDKKAEIPHLIEQERRSIRHRQTYLRKVAAKKLAKQEGTRIPGYGRGPMSEADRARLKKRAEELAKLAGETFKNAPNQITP